MTDEQTTIVDGLKGIFIINFDLLLINTVTVYGFIYSYAKFKFMMTQLLHSVQTLNSVFGRI